MKFGEKLIQAGLIDKAQLDAALRHQEQTGQMLGEALVELGYISEESFLKFLAKDFSTRYVSTRKLSRVKPDPALLEKIPVQLAEQRLVFPILLAKDGKTIGVVGCEPQNEETLEEVRIISGMEKVSIFVASRDAIRAMIKKHYRGDIHAFEMLDKAKDKHISDVAELYSDRVLSEEGIQMEESARPRSSGPAVQDLSDAEARMAHQTSSWTRAIEDVRGGSLLSDNDFIETLNILVGLVEMQLPNRQGHSARIAKTVKAVSERMELTETEINHNIIAAYLHDLGKRASSHLTLLSIGANKEHRHRAKRYYLTPSRLFDAVHLPRPVNRMLAHLYENFDGTGIPEGLSGDQIPLGSRIIAVVDAFDDLVHNSANLVGATLEPEQALARMGKEGGSLFDPRIVEVLKKTLSGQPEEEADHSGLEPVVLVADPDAVSTSELELKLAAAGFEVRAARDSAEAMDCLAREEVTFAVVDLMLEPDDGFVLLEEIQKMTRNIPVFLTAADPMPEAITKAFKEGAVDFITKPTMPDIVVAKVQKELAAEGIELPEEPLSATETQPPRSDFDEQPEIVDPETGITIEVEGQDEDEEEGEAEESLPTPTSVTMSGVGGSKGNIISGSLEGKTALSLIRALSAKRRTGLLSLRIGENKGEMYFQEGHIFQAILGEVQGEEAFLELASWHECLYRFDPEQAPKSRQIKTPTGKLIQIAQLSG